MEFGHDLIQAYKGTYEDKYEKTYRGEYEDYVEKEGDNGKYAVESWEGWIDRKVEQHIREDDNKTRLKVYCEWNGLINYSDRLYRIATEGK